MLKYDDYFNNQFQFSLDNIEYKSLEASLSSDLSLKVSDDMSIEITENHLLLTIVRRLGFEPSCLFELTVSMKLSLEIKANTEDKVKEIDWITEFAENNNPYLSNVMSRISALISSITASYGQQPIVTPPTFMVSGK